MLDMKPTATMIAPTRRLSVFALYVDLLAAVHARRFNERITRLCGAQCKPSIELWNFNSVLPRSPIREMIAAEAAGSDVLLVAMSSLAERQPELIDWLNSLIAMHSSRPVPGALIGLFGREEERPGELDWTVAAFTGVAHRIGRNFAWQWMGREAGTDFEWLPAMLEQRFASDLTGPQVDAPNESLAQMV